MLFNVHIGRSAGFGVIFGKLAGARLLGYAKCSCIQSFGNKFRFRIDGVVGPQRYLSKHSIGPTPTEPRRDLVLGGDKFGIGSI